VKSFKLFKNIILIIKSIINMNSKVRKAVFPIAGFGTRFLPATKAMPKELLPIIDKPLIQFAAEEAIAAGVDTLIFITGRNKRAIEDHLEAIKNVALTHNFN
jgi:UTP-glucose-1-phosphate uridylyltransferase